MRRTLFIAGIISAGLSSALFSQGQLQSAHQPVVSAASPAPVRPGAAAVVARAPEKEIGRVNRVAVTQSELDEELQRLFPYYAIHGGKVPAALEAELRKQAIHDTVLHELVYQEARRRNLQVSALKWQNRLQQIGKGFPSRQAYEAATVKKYGSVAEFERRLRRAMLVEQLWEYEVVRKSVVTPEIARAYYDSHKAQFVRPEAVWLQTITIKFPASATAEQKREARKITEQILVKAKAAQNYEEFGVLAEKLSQDDWRVMMGDHRWVHRGTVTPDIEQAVFSLKKGETSGIVESANGYVILRANDHQPKRQMSFAEMSASLRPSLEKQRREKRAKEFEELLRSKAKVEIL